MPEKKIRIAVFAEGDDAEMAKKNGLGYSWFRRSC